MKVTTDSCLFGAWVAKTIHDKQLSLESILDIGAGTGLLSLMLAQALLATIDAVEIDEAAAIQAGENFITTPWAKQLQVFHSAIQQFSSTTNKRYDFIVTNPPFFDNDLISPNAKRNMALHSTTLSLEALILAIQQLLANDGSFAILLPYNRTDYFVELTSKHGFFLHKKTLVKQTTTHPYFRVMLLFGYQQKKIEVAEIVIKQAKLYTTEFKLLLKDYYLHF